MANEITTYSSTTAVAVPNWQRQNIKLLVKNQTTFDLQQTFKPIIAYGIVYKGQNKTDNELDLLTNIFTLKVQEKFPYLTSKQVEIALKNSDFGDYGITVENLVKCVDKYYPADKQKEQRSIEKTLQTDDQSRKEKTLKKEVFTDQEKIDFLKDANEFFAKCKYVGDVGGYVWKFAREWATQNNYKPAFADRRRYLNLAKQASAVYFTKKYKFKYKTAYKVLKDKALMKSEEWLLNLKLEFREYWLREFFKNKGKEL